VQAIQEIPTLDDAEPGAAGNGVSVVAEAPQGWTASVLNLADLDGGASGGVAPGVGDGATGGMTARTLATLPTVTPEGVDLSLLKQALLPASHYAEGDEQWRFDTVLGQLMLRLGTRADDAASPATGAATAK
jgi:hypothetical protein